VHLNKKIHAQNTATGILVIINLECISLIKANFDLKLELILLDQKPYVYEFLSLFHKVLLSANLVSLSGVPVMENLLVF